MTDYSDEELMGMVGNDDVSAFEKLFHRHKRRVFDFLYRMTWNTEEAKDCTQETFLRLWQARARYSPKAKFTTYLFQIAKNHFLDVRRKQRSRVDLQRLSVDAPEQRFESSVLSSSVYEAAVAKEIRSAISRAVARLPEMHRVVYVLSQGHRMSYSEIAAILGCPVGTVSSRKVEAVKKLRKMLEPLKDELLGKGFRSDKGGSFDKNGQERDR